MPILQFPQYDCMNLLQVRRKDRVKSKMLLHTISGRLVTDSACQSASQNIGLIRLMFVTAKVTISGLANVTTVNNSFLISCVKSMANSSLFRTVSRCTEHVKQPSRLQLNNLPHFRHVATLPCDLSLITMHASDFH